MNVLISAPVQRNSLQRTRALHFLTTILVLDFFWKNSMLRDGCGSALSPTTKSIVLVLGTNQGSTQLLTGNGID